MIDLFWDESEGAFIDIGGENRDAEAGAFGDENADFVDFADLVTEDRGHVLDGIICFEISGLVADPSVSGRVRSVKAVAGEFFESIENFVGDFGGDVVEFGGSIAEFDALFAHLFLVLLSHGAAEQVGTSEGVAGEDLGGLHDLFLVNEDPVGFLGHFIQERVRCLDLGFAVFAFDVIGDEIHRAWPIEGENGVDIFDIGNGELSADPDHSTRL